MIAFDWKYVAVDRDGGVTLYKGIPWLDITGRYFDRKGELLTVFLPDEFPSKGHCRLTPKYYSKGELIMKKSSIEGYNVLMQGVSLEGFCRAPYLFKLPEPVEIRRKLCNPERYYKG